MKRLPLKLPAFGLLALLVAACSDTTTTAPETVAFDRSASLSNHEPTYTETWDGVRGLTSLRCDKLGEGPRGPEGWIHWIFATKGSSTSATLHLGGTGSGDYTPGEPLNANTWHFYTPFFDLEGLTAEIKLFGGAPGSGGGLVLSDYCPGGGLTLEVSKTADTKFTRTHEWDIDKKVETQKGHTIGEAETPKIWLYTDGSGDEKATWTVDVSYEGSFDSNFKIFGTITIKNISNPAETKSITSIVDDLGLPGYDNVAVSCKDGGGTGFDQGDLPRDIAAGETWTCSYAVHLAPGVVEADDDGENVVSVTVEGETDPYSAGADWEFDKPTTEVNKTVNIEDISDLFGTKNLGSVTAPNGDSFTYHKKFEWEDYGADGCGSFRYDNTAKIKETGQSADATLKVNVQCFVDETAYAKGNNPDPAKQVVAFCDAGFSQWGWTNRIGAGTYTWDLWAGAGQCDTARGTHVGTATVTYAGGTATVNLDIAAGFTLLDKHFYAGSTQFPQQRQGPRTVNTVAPGQYTIGTGLSGDIWVIVHAVVGFPDPDFGP